MRHRRDTKRPHYTFCGIHLLGELPVKTSCDWRAVQCQDCQKFRKRRVRKQND